ncbi:amino acid ABC transporter permease [Mesorhizobium sp. PUT5]|uniref:amino acid ABC transporter permease n=1 Tax=Mesorhizobium sp. PUT5 TaxID=3454629 RepID=UPI003FA40A8F
MSPAGYEATGARHRLLAILKPAFGTPVNAALTVAIMWLLVTAIPALLRWGIADAVWATDDPKKCIQQDGACWAFIGAKLRLIIFGRYPYDEQWRPLLAMVIVLAALALSADWRQWRRRGWGRFLIGLWAAAIAAAGILMAGGVAGLDRVEIDRWSGLPLTVMLSVFGIFLALVLSVLLALGRQSELPVIRWLSIAYIELIRGVPLISILFMAALMLPIILPSGFEISKILRAQAAFVMFFAAYMAEVLRGGLQAIPRGQYEAAEAIGLTYREATFKVILPQVFRLTIPSLVNVFIAAFKDTSLVVIISMHDLMGTTNAAISDPAWSGVYIEAYAFTAMIYFFFCGGISWYSQKLERHLKTGRRP